MGSIGESGVKVGNLKMCLETILGFKAEKSRGGRETKKEEKKEISFCLSEKEEGGENESYRIRYSKKQCEFNPVHTTIEQ